MIKENHCTFLDLPKRPKPRHEGMTSFFDYFIPLRDLETLLEVAADAMDWAKLIHIGLAANLPEGWLDRKLHLYRERGIKTYPGGIPYQVALTKNKVEEYFDWLVEMGFDAVEIAEDAMKSVMPTEKRGELINMAIDRGLEVHTEIGKKHPEKPLQLDEAFESIMYDLNLGVSHCVIERSELDVYIQSGDASPLLGLVEQVGLKNLLFEPGPFGWPQVHKWCFQTFGRNVNLGNISKEEILYVEWSRIGMSRFVDFDYFDASFSQPSEG